MLAGSVSPILRPSSHVEGPREGYAFTPVKCLLPTACKTCSLSRHFSSFKSL